MGLTEGSGKRLLNDAIHRAGVKSRLELVLWYQEKYEQRRGGEVSASGQCRTSVFE
jgi:hypothetical protein